MLRPAMPKKSLLVAGTRKRKHNPSTTLPLVLRWCTVPRLDPRKRRSEARYTSAEPGRCPSGATDSFSSPSPLLASHGTLSGMQRDWRPRAATVPGAWPRVLTSSAQRWSGEGQMVQSPLPIARLRTNTLPASSRPSLNARCERQRWPVAA
jgi:hypothetical protein